MVKINLKYSRGEEGSVKLTEKEAAYELTCFLNRVGEAGQKQWMKKVKSANHKKDVADFFRWRYDT